MLRLTGTFVLAALALHWSQPAPAQNKRQVTRAIFIMTPSGWMLEVFTDGGGLLQYGSSAGDGWGFKAGTIDVAKAEKDLRALPSDDKGGIGSHFSFSFESERKAPDQPGRARYTRDLKVVPGLLKAAADGTAVRNEFRAQRRAELLKKKPPGELPKEK